MPASPVVDPFQKGLASLLFSPEMSAALGQIPKVTNTNHLCISLLSIDD